MQLCGAPHNCIVIHGCPPNGLRCLGPGAKHWDPVHHHLPGDSHLSLKGRRAHYGIYRSSLIYRHAPETPTNWRSVPLAAASRCNDRPAQMLESRQTRKKDTVIVRVLAIKAFALTWWLHRQLSVDGGLGFEFLATFQGIGYRPNGGGSVSWYYRLA